MIQKQVSPVAFKLDFHTGSDVYGIGYDMSIGLPTTGPSYRKHFGSTKYYRYYDNAFLGTEKRSGAELGFNSFLTFSGTEFNSGDISQTTNSITIGGPLSNFVYENDMISELSWVPGIPKGSGDKYRTASVQFNAFDHGYGFNLMTGDKGGKIRDDEGNIISDNVKDGVYIKGGTGDPDKYRLGALYVRGGPLKLGWNSEKIRNYYQNELHKIKGDPIFRVLDIKGRFFWYFGSGTGNTLW
jgi:hypothetical protein